MDDNTNPTGMSEEERRKTIAECEKAQAEEDAKLRELIATPLAVDEAEKMFADSKVEAAKLAIIRRKWEAQIDEMQDRINQIRKRLLDIDDRLMALRMQDAIAYRRTLNVKAEPQRETK